jgi:hypothetical protein
MEQIEMKTVTTGTTRWLATDDQPFTRAAALVIGKHALSDAARLAGGDQGLSDAVARMSATGGGSLAAAYERRNAGSLPRMASGTASVITTAGPRGATPPMSAAPQGIDGTAHAILAKCADAAERVHGTGKYART